jgi:hypothetical protein
MSACHQKTACFPCKKENVAFELAKQQKKKVANPHANLNYNHKSDP